MPKTEVILTSNIVGLGAESDHVKVAAGYARNYLLPQGLAIPLTGANKRRIEVLRQRRAERESHELNSMSELAKSINKMTTTIKVKTGDDGKMFGSVTAGTIADELKHQFDITLDKKKIHLDHPIKTLGEHDVELRLHADVKASLKVIVESTTPLPVPEPAVEDRRGRRPGRGEEREGPGETAPARTDRRPPRRFDRAPQAEAKPEGKPKAEAKPEGKPRAGAESRPKGEKAK
jgi:large subunit ribosomal protein L9